ncbi:MAG: DUF5674 family protein [Candidatus Saganbacteria bacterium]|nr:DUF5674 family protein [Candidatus Saganbacteria bacterium]
MKIISDSIDNSELIETSKRTFGNMVKAVVDIDKGIMAIDGELHSDEESLLIENGSKQSSLWGINIYPEEKDDGRIEFDSMINLRPSQANRSRSVESPAIRDKIIEIVARLVKR